MIDMQSKIDRQCVSSALIQADYSMQFAVRHLQEANANASPVESIILLPMLRAARELHQAIEHFQTARAE